jgi:hypothetical protein
VKLDVDTLPTVPDDPPAAGPDRALDPDPSCAADAEGDMARPTESPITGHITAAATIRPNFLLDRRLELGRATARVFSKQTLLLHGTQQGEGHSSGIGLGLHQRSDAQWATLAGGHTDS